MFIEAQVAIDASRKAVWDAITNIENAAETISGIDQIEILEKPEDELVGLKWRETRTLFGKTATEVMWITDSVENEFYEARAESHGFIYISTMRISEDNDGVSLKMTHLSKPQGFVVKLLSIPMGLVFKRILRKAIMQDLNDIKVAVERE